MRMGIGMSIARESVTKGIRLFFVDILVVKAVLGALC